MPAEPAREILEELIAALGLHFHPEMPVAGYLISDEGWVGSAQLLSILDPVTELVSRPMFSSEDAERLQAGLDHAWDLHGDGIFELIKQIEPWKSFFTEAAG